MAEDVRSSLADICHRLANNSCLFADVANQLADAASAIAADEGEDAAIRELAAAAAVLKATVGKHAAEGEALYGLNLLIGEMLLDARRYDESREWLEKAICVNESGDAALHDLALNALACEDLPAAVRALENEIAVAPGNYYSYMLLADVFTRLGDDIGAERTLCSLLERDAMNIRALHMLILLYRRRHPEADVALLRERIVRSDVHPAALDLSIWTLYQIESEQFTAIHHRLAEVLDTHPALSIVHLLRAQVYGVVREFSLKRLELIAFIRENYWNPAAMRVKLDEFGMVFGAAARRDMAERISSLVPGHAADELLH